MGEYFKPEHRNRRQHANWQDDVIKNWAHLRELPTSDAEKFDVIPITCVERTVMAGRDADNTGRYWAVVDSDFCPWPEVYYDDDYGDAIRVPPFNAITGVAGRPQGSKRKKRVVDESPTHSDGNSSGTDEAFSSDSEEDFGAAGDAEAHLDLDDMLAEDIF